MSAMHMSAQSSYAARMSSLHQTSSVVKKMPTARNVATRVGWTMDMEVEAPKAKKLVYFMRHGTTEMNQYLRRVPYGSPGFRDPLFYDTQLTAEGKAGAKRAAQVVRSLHPQPELLVVSPLRRAIQTAHLAWLPHYNGPVLVEALARERVWLSSDVGSHPQELQQAFPELQDRLSFDHLPDVWWWNNGSSDPKHVHLEPECVFKARVDKFRSWLRDRPEGVIGVVAHWGLLEALTGLDFENCELRGFTLHPSGQLEPLVERTPSQQGAQPSYVGIV